MDPKPALHTEVALPLDQQATDTKLAQARSSKGLRRKSLKFLASTTLVSILILYQEQNVLPVSSNLRTDRADAFQLADDQATKVTNGNKSVQPQWHKPGCFQVGHTRTISIPGCVKFNLSTNACRGFCMSFSIPAANDIGPQNNRLPMEHLDGIMISDQYDPNRPLASIQTALPMIENGDSEAANSNPRYRMVKKLSSSLSYGQSLGQLVSSTNTRHNQSDLNSESLTIPQKSPLAGAIGDTSDKRDIISVGQCCSMMETEDVEINLRCGFNETRKLIFKSAKTCECFFCKHV